jgi:hypothetical protein
MLPPDASPCWAGAWSSAGGLVDLWAHSAVLRTVGALPTLHPWRLGDVKGSSRTLLWCASPDGGDAASVAVLSQYAPEPDLGVGEVGPDGQLLGADALATATGIDGVLSDLVVGLSREVADAVADAVATPSSRRDLTSTLSEPPPGVTRWVGGLAKIAGSWLPELAIMPTSGRDADDPGSRWGTESLAFADRHTVHAADTRFASDVLAPHLTALILDRVPEDAAVTIAGDALHVWWSYTPQSRMTPGRVAGTVQTAALLRDAIPSFVLADHPDHSHQVEDRLADRAREAAAYRAARDAGRHPDPTLQRIYDQARAEWEAGSEYRH